MTENKIQELLDVVDQAAISLRNYVEKQKESYSEFNWAENSLNRVKQELVNRSYFYLNGSEMEFKNGILKTLKSNVGIDVKFTPEDAKVLAYIMLAWAEKKTKERYDKTN
jgi:hypothetical protein